MAKLATRLLVLTLVLYVCAGASSADQTGPESESGLLLGRTFYIRQDGGSQDQCTGLVDAAYPGSGQNQPCAWDHPFRALPPDMAPRIQGGDTLIIGSGSYMMGYGAPGADACSSDWTYDCHMPPIPSGPDPAHPTRILGSGWDSGCAASPELWGTERTTVILNLRGSSNVEIACLEITDHSSCVEDHLHGVGGSSLTCVRDPYPHGPWAATGLYAEDSTNVTLRHLDIHGLATHGIMAGRLQDWTVEDVRIAANGWAGWEGDIDGFDGNTGIMRFRRWTVEWNGCAETYPGEQPTGCWSQTAGGYGDGAGSTGGDWIIEDSRFLHNTSDGLDLLYHDLGGQVTLDRVRAEGNAGNPVKVTGQATIVNSVIVANCAYFEDKPFTANVDPCRAAGNALHLSFTGGERNTITNTTIHGQGDGLILANPREGYQCDGWEQIIGRNNLLLGGPDWGDDEDITFHFYQERCRDLKLDSDYSIAFQTKNMACGQASDDVRSGANDLCQDPLVTGPLSGDAYGLLLREGSPAIDAGTAAGAPLVDFAGRQRDGRPDMGAYEFAASAWQPLHLPLILKWKGWIEVVETFPPQIDGCDIFATDNIWNVPVDMLPMHPSSAAYVATIGSAAHVHADFGSGEWPPGSGSPIGIPFVVVPGDQAKAPVSFRYADESDPGPYPIPPDPPIEGGSGSTGDRHILVLDRDTCLLYELFDAWPQPDGSWSAGSGAIFDLTSYALRPDTWTSADAAGLPILPGLVRYDEVASGEIRHAIRFTAPQTQRAYVWPARHHASHLTGSQYPPMGQRFRLKADYDISGFSPQCQVILRAMKKYGIMLADNGASWFISGAPDERWDNDALHELHQIKGAAFEAVDISTLQIHPDSAQALGQ